MDKSLPQSLPSWFDDVINGKPDPKYQLIRQIERTGALKR